MNIEKQRIAGLPPAAYYVPDFVSEHEEAYLLQKVEHPRVVWRSSTD